MANVSNQSLDDDELKESNSEADFSISDASDRKAKRKDSKRLFTKKESKDKGYSTLNADNSQESIFLMTNTKSSKKPKQDVKIGLFKKTSTKEDKEKKAKQTSTPESSKRVKVEKRKKVKDVEIAQNVNKILFEESLENTIAAFPCNDGLCIPYPIRMCFDIIEEKGLECEGIYRRIRNKSQIDGIFEAINTNFESKLSEINADPLIAGSIVKKFFRDLKSPLISDEFLNLFEKNEHLSDKDVDLKIETFRKTLKKMPAANRDTFSFLIVHLSKIMQKSEMNKMDMQNIILTFQSIIRIKERLFKFILKNSSLIFKDFRYRKYHHKSTDESATRQSKVLPGTVEELEREIANQEGILFELHAKIAKNEKDKQMQEQLLEELWVLQRYVTSLKRKVKQLKMEQKSSLDIQVQEITNAVAKNNTVNSTEKKGENKSTEGTRLRYLENSEIVHKDLLIKTISENEILVETLHALFEKLSKEKVKIFDLQQQHKVFPNSLANQNEVLNYDAINMNDLQRNLDQLLSENKQIKDKISLTNEKISIEKRKIFKLKSDIKYHDFKYYLDNPVISSPVNRLTSPVLQQPQAAMSPTNVKTAAILADNGTTTKL